MRRRSLIGVRLSSWHIQRLRAMSSHEIAWRAKIGTRGMVDRTARRLVWERRSPLSATETNTPLGFLTRERASLVFERLPHAALEIVARSEQYESGRFAFFGDPEVVVAEVADYTHDPASGRAWPRSYGPSIDYRSGLCGDPKWVWELNRLQHLPVGIQAWLLTGDRAHADWVARVLEEWVVANPVSRGIAWANGYEAGLRAISCALCWDALRGSGIQTPAARHRIMRSLWQHARWIRRRPSAFSSANNHRIGELAGLAAVGLLVPELDEASAWLDEAIEQLAVEVDLQILPDGTGAEQAFEYTVFVLDLVLLVVSLLDARGVEPPVALIGALSRGGRAVAALQSPGEPEPHFGDGDDGRAARLDSRAHRDVRGVLAAVAVRTGTADLTDAGSEIDETVLWLFGDLEAPMSRLERRESVYLPDGGIVVLRDSTRRVCVDVGQHGYLALAAHAHADALQVTVCDGSLDVIVDPGTGSYFRNGAAHKALRGSAAHATICVDGRDQAEQRASFLWSDHYRSSVDHISLDHGSVVAHHDGYRRLSDPVVHRRSVRLKERSPLLVYDRLDAASGHHYVQTWPVGPHLEVEEIDSRLVRLVHADGRTFLLAFAASVPAQLELVRGSHQPFEGWWSPHLEMVEPAWVCRWRFEGAGNVHCAAALSPASDDGGSAMELRLHLDRAEPVAVIDYRGVRVEHTLGMFAHAQTGRG